MVTDTEGNIYEKDMSPEEKEQHDLADSKDKERDEKNARVIKEAMNEGLFTRLWVINEPKYLVYFGLIGAMMVGCSQPVWAIYYSRMITFMTAPLNMMQYVYPYDF